MSPVIAMTSVPTDPYELLHWNMILGVWFFRRHDAGGQILTDGVSIVAHQTYEKGYENIVRLLCNPPKDDLKNFLGYCEAWGYSVVHHHDIEVCISAAAQAASCIRFAHSESAPSGYRKQLSSRS